MTSDCGDLGNYGHSVCSLREILSNDARTYWSLAVMASAEGNTKLAKAYYNKCEDYSLASQNDFLKP